jgi:hypothetical protein
MKLKKKLSKIWRKGILAALFGPNDLSFASGKILSLLSYAELLIDFCRASHVKAFMTCENYHIWADSMGLIADDLAISTMSYQYSVLRRSSSPMLMPCDKMFVFSPLFNQHWTYQGIRPREFLSTGYLYDYAFDLVKQHSQEVRAQLEKAGVDFVICYFDETIVWHKKYGVLTPDNYEQHFLEVAQFVLERPQFGLVTKSQFQFNKISHFTKLNQVIAELEKQGRCYQFSKGKHRNVVFPAEAALASDITIGELVGGTASLEAALAGVRSIIVNNFGVQTLLDQLYESENIVVSSTQKALEAIEEYRNKKASRSKLGDWSNIINQFDSHRDGRAYKRMRDVIDSTLEPHL